MSTSKGKGRTSYRQRAERAMSRQLSQVDAAGAAFDAYAAVADDYAKRLTKLHEDYEKERTKLEDARAKAAQKALTAYSAKYEVLINGGVSPAILDQSGLPEPGGLLRDTGTAAAPADTAEPRAAASIRARRSA